MNTLIQQLFIRLYSHLPTSASRQRGATSLEYLMLAAVVIAILVFLSTNTEVRQAISDAFSNIFNVGSDAADAAAAG